MSILKRSNMITIKAKALVGKTAHLMKTPKTPSIKARKVVAADIPWSMRPGSDPSKPYLILPGDVKAYDAMVTHVAYSLLSEGKVTTERAKDIVPHIAPRYVMLAHAALAALGIKRPSK